MRKFTIGALCILMGISAAFGQTTILQEDFEGGTLPTNWTRTQATPSVGWEIGNNLGSQFFPIPAHTVYAASNDDAHDDNSTTLNDASRDRLITPVMDFTPYASAGVVINFDYIQPGQWGSSGELEVSTNGGSSWTSVATITPDANWANTTVNLSAYTSSNTVMVAFKHDDGGGWSDGFGVDNVLVKSVPGLDAMMEEITVGDYVAAGNINVTGAYSNQGYQSLTSLTVNYSINGGTPYSANLTGLNLPLGSSGTFTHSTPANFSTPGSYTLKVWVSAPNGGTDAVASNDTLTKTVNVLSSIPVKNAILEDHTGAWCQFCPDGTVIAEQVDANYGSQSIIMAVHNSDAMAIADGNQISGAYISGFPGGVIDHFKFPDQQEVQLNRGSWDAKMSERLTYIVPVSASFESVNWNAGTRQISATVRADFFGSASGDIRMNCVILEDSVVGSGSGYDQVNFYNTQNGHPFYGAGNPIVGFVHDHTARAFLGGAWGQSGIIPASVNDGDNYSNTFTYNLPANFDEKHIKLVAIVQMYDNDPEMREILNSESYSLSSLVAVEDNEVLQQEVQVYPNPFASYTNIQFTLEKNTGVTVEVHDLFGKRIAVLADGQMNKGTHSVRWNGTQFGGSPVVNGVYLVSIKAGNQSFVEKVILNR